MENGDSKPKLVAMFCPKCGRRMIRLKRKKNGNFRYKFSLSDGSLNPIKWENKIGCPVWRHRFGLPWETYEAEDGECYARTGGHGIGGLD